MKGHTLIKPLEEDVVIGMGGIIHQTANYKNYKNAIGYSFRFYSTELVKVKKDSSSCDKWSTANKRKYHQ